MPLNIFISIKFAPGCCYNCVFAVSVYCLGVRGRFISQKICHIMQEDKTMQKKSKTNDHEISLIITYGSILAWMGILFIWFLTSEKIVPKFVNYLVLWFPTIGQMISCYFAVRFIRQNPDKRKKGIGGIVLVLVFYIGTALLSFVLTQMHVSLMNGRNL